MAIYLCHERPDLVDYETEVVDSRPGWVLLAEGALHPGGGGQPPDRATLEHRDGVSTVVDVAEEGGLFWYRLETADVLRGVVRVRIDEVSRFRVAQLHTATHILNALVFQRFDGALVTGVNIEASGAARMDFDLPGVDHTLLRGLDDDMNAAIRAGLDVRATYVPAESAATTPGLVRSRSVAPPPTPDGRLRVIEIAGLDRQACGGTHLTNTAQSAPVHVTKIDNKGRHNRRVRIALADAT
ncbi:MAG TPA: alanyl-tRNA editing protein [Candidatus Dormibacteraeota bacterium]|nr:alanyl-tRNA editing protein [Candidatus Dormibacteraeota bacterium]